MKVAANRVIPRDKAVQPSWLITSTAQLASNNMSEKALTNDRRQFDSVYGSP